MIDDPPMRQSDLRGQLSVVRMMLQNNCCLVVGGPHQVGKSKFVEAIVSQLGIPHSTLRLSEQSDREALAEHTDFFSNNAGRLLVVDDAHLLPDCFIRAQEQCEKAKRQDVGHFLLVGITPDVRKLANDTLAGIHGEVRISPFHLLELSAAEQHPLNAQEAQGGVMIEVLEESQKPIPPQPLATQDELWLRGGFPRSLFGDEAGSRRWRIGYLEAWYEREVPNLNPALGSHEIQRVFRTIAENQAGEFKPDHLPKDLRMCVGHFERAGLIRQLHPWPHPINGNECPFKKIFIRDSGLLHAIHAVWTLGDLRARNLQGSSWEGFCVENLISVAGRRYEASHFRASNAPVQDEVDLILKFPSGKLVVVECKVGRGSLSPGYHRICQGLAKEHPEIERIAIRALDTPTVINGVTHISLFGAMQIVLGIAAEEAANNPLAR